MILEALLETVHIRSSFSKLVVGSALAAFLVSLGTVLILQLIAVEISPAVPAVLGVVAAAAYAARMKGTTSGDTG